MKYNLFCKFRGPHPNGCGGRDWKYFPNGFKGIPKTSVLGTLESSAGLYMLNTVGKNSNKDYYALTVVFNKTNEDI